MRLHTKLPVLPLWLAFVVAAVGGVINSCAFPGLGWWPLSFVSLFLLWWSLSGRRFYSGLIIGFVFGLTMWLALINWLTLYLGPTPWIALAVTEALYVALACGGIAFVLSYGSRVLEAKRAGEFLITLGVSGLWVAHEGLAAVWPWGGFSWGRTGMAQVSGPLAGFASWVGIAGLSLIVSWLTVTLVRLLVVSTRRRVAPFGIAAAVTVLAIVMPLYPSVSSGTLNISAIQGNTKSGLFDNVNPGDNLEKNVETTLRFAKAPVDLVVWPENGADVDPSRDAQALTTISTLSRKYSAPFLVGTITKSTAGQYFNSSLLISDNSIVAQYDKVHPVPFAEYMPARDFFHALVPDLVDMVWRDYTPGSRPNTMVVDGAKIGLAICFDIVDDQLMYDLEHDGAQVVIAQTNNADFGNTVEHLQQLDIARMRAIETGKYVVNVSTVGTTAVINSQGTVLLSLQPHTEGALNVAVPLIKSLRPGLIVGRAVEIAASVLGLSLWAALLIMWFRRRDRDANANRQVAQKE